MKKISVIIPIYNTEEFLPECMDSIINQSYSNIEILMINDGSNDSCTKMIEKYEKSDPRIQSYHISERKGVGAARNLGLDKATGDYIYFLDSDDYLPLTTLSLLIENIEEHPILAGKVKKITRKEVFEASENRLKYIKNKQSSVLNMLISRDFIEGNGIRFSEKIEYYSDWSFLFPIQLQMKKIPYLTYCFYFKRVRNDPITNPALIQMDSKRKLLNFLRLFNQLKADYQGDEEANRLLNRQFLNYYRKSIVIIFSDKNNVNQYFEAVADAVKKISPSSYKKINPLVKMELNSLRKNKQKSYERYFALHREIRNLKKAFDSKRKFYIYLYRTFFIRLPMKNNRIVFESFLGKNYADSPKNIYEYMVEKNLGYQYVWIFNEKKDIPGNAIQVNRFSLRYYYYLATSKYWVSNSRLPLHLGKREGIIYLQTWHGTPLKKLVFDMNDVYSANPHYKRHFFIQSRRWDYLIAANPYSSEIFKRAFKFEKEMLEYGYPRNDILHSPNKEELARQIKIKLGIPLDKKVILYAPTWRDDEFYEPGKYKFTLKLDLPMMKQELGDEYVILLRMHYFIADNIETTGAENFAYNLSNYNDIADLYLISDLLITDYSSVFFDYSNLRRPILFYTYDLEKYRDTLRGFYIDMENDVPGPLLKTTEEVCWAIKHTEQVMEEYRAKYDRFYEMICSWEKGTATEQVVKHVFGGDDAGSE